MSNVIQFPEASGGRASNAAVDLRHGRAFLDEPADHDHAVQFYESDGFLVDTVSRFLGAGAEAGDRIVVIASAAHADAFTEHLEGRDALVASGQLTVLDARETLSKLMVDGMPDPDRFRTLIAQVVSRALDGHPGARLRLYGEMVDLLWREGSSRAAIQLEELWNEAGKSHSFALLCAYVMGNFYNEGDEARFLEVCRNHNHVIPAESVTRLDDPHARLHEVSRLQQRARALESEVHHRRELEAALRDALRERSRAEEELRACVKREKEARAQAEASDAFKELFLGILGHDLRNPLNTVLTTARLMALRGELPPDSDKRLARIVTAGERMERMITQILDVTRARLAQGIPVDRSSEHDLASIVTRIVDELRGAHPGREVELRALPCAAPLDPDRVAQVVSNLLGNAVSHGDPRQPITVTVAARDGMARVSVHNFGPPIDAAFLPRLFDPFRPGPAPGGRSEGLGLGLYIAERVVTAHGGRLEVSSSSAAGTTFEATFPQAAP